MDSCFVSVSSFTILFCCGFFDSFSKIIMIHSVDMNTNWWRIFRFLDSQSDFSTWMRYFNSIWILSKNQKSWISNGFHVLYPSVHITVGNGNQPDGVNQWELTVPLEFSVVCSLSWYYVLFLFQFFLLFITLTAKIVDTHAFQCKFGCFDGKTQYTYTLKACSSIHHFIDSHFTHFQWKTLSK